jgi:hypothetical protein
MPTGIATGPSGQTLACQLGHPGGAWRAHIEVAAAHQRHGDTVDLPGFNQTEAIAQNRARASIFLGGWEPVAMRAESCAVESRPGCRKRILGFLR